MVLVSNQLHIGCTKAWAWPYAGGEGPIHVSPFVGAYCIGNKKAGAHLEKVLLRFQIILGNSRA